MLTKSLFGVRNMMAMQPIINQSSMLAANSQRGFAWTKKQEAVKKWNIVKDDEVEVISGRYKGQRGKVIKVKRNKNMLIVKGVNLKYQAVDDEEMVRRRKIVQIEGPVHYSNVALICPETGLATRIRHGFLENGEKVRVS